MKHDDEIYITYEEDILRKKLNTLDNQSDLYRILSAIYNVQRVPVQVVKTLKYVTESDMDGTKVFNFKSIDGLRLFHYTSDKSFRYHTTHIFYGSTALDKNRIYFNRQNAVEWCRSTNGRDPLALRGLEEVLLKSKEKVEKIALIYNSKDLSVTTKYDTIREILLHEES